MVGLRSSSLNILIAATLAWDASGANEVALPIVILHMISASTTLKMITVALDGLGGNVGRDK